MGRKKESIGIIKELTMRTEMVVKKFGYEYILVESMDRPGNMQMPCMFGMKGYALKSVRKIKKEEK